MIKAITIGDNSAGLWRNLEFFGRKFENGGKRCSLRNAEPEIVKKNRKIRMIENDEKEKRECVMMTYTLKGSFGSEVRVTLNETFPPPFAILTIHQQ